MWHGGEFVGKAFAIIDPGRQTLLHVEIVKPEGRIHFTREHARLYPARIQGAFESSLNAAIAARQTKRPDGVTTLSEIDENHPACAVFYQVLNLLSQVGPDPETPPWLRPIALFL